MIPLPSPTPAVQALADTVVTIPSRGVLAMATDGAILFLALVFAATLIGLLFFLGRLRRTERELRGLIGEVKGRSGPLLERTRDIADNVEFVTRAVRTDVERLNASVRALSDRLGQASDRMEERIEEFNALMEVVQSEAEDIFLGTASTVRGVRAGARALGGGKGAAEPDPGEEGVYLTGSPSARRTGEAGARAPSRSDGDAEGGGDGREAVEGAGRVEESTGVRGRRAGNPGRRASDTR